MVFLCSWDIRLNQDAQSCLCFSDCLFRMRSLDPNAEGMSTARPLIRSAGLPQLAPCHFASKGKHCFSGSVSDGIMSLITFRAANPLSSPKAFTQPSGLLLSLSSLSPAPYFLPLSLSFSPSFSGPSLLPLHAWRSREMQGSTCLTDYCNSYTLISCTNH